ncbi:MAG: MoaD family protein [Actinomycetota bacterium]
MSVELKIPALLRSHVGGVKQLEVPEGSLRELLEAVAAEHPAFGTQIFEEEGALHRFVNVYVNDEDARYLDGLETQVVDGDVVAILPAVAGG